MGRHFEVRAAAMAATAKAKSAIYMRASKEIYAAAKSGVPDPESNLALRSAIEKYRKDEATYSKLKEHIDIEWLFPAKCAIGLYSNQYDVSEIKPKFKSLCNSLGITKVAENVGIENFIDTF